LKERVPVKRIEVRFDRVWPVAGLLEELRNHGVAIPPEAEAIVREGLLKVNFPRFMTRVFPRNLARLRGILESLDVPDQLPDVYKDEYRFAAHPWLEPFVTGSFLEDRLLGVGLKSYPYVLDYDGDGNKDLLVGDHDGFIYVFLNQNTDADPVFGRGQRLRAVDTGEPFIVQPNPKMSFGDLTGTGSLDLVLGNYAGRVAFVPNRARDGTFAFAIEDVEFLRTESGDIDVGNYAYPELVDWNGDGRLDLVVGNIDGKLLLFRNGGASDPLLFQPGVEIPGIEPLMYPCPVFADWNGDGRKDLILGHRNGTVILYANVGTDGAPEFERHDVARHADGEPVDVGLLSHPFAVDWNNDGLIDLVVGNDPGQVQVFLNVGSAESPVFDRGRALRDGGGELIMGVHSVFAPVDFNGDGRCDVLVGHQTGRLRLFENVGTAAQPAFDDYREIEGVAVDADHLAEDDPEARAYWDLDGLAFNTEYLGNLAPCPVDWQNTGKLDLLVGHYSGLVYLFENVGTRSEPRYESGKALRAGGKLLRVAAFSTPVVCDWNNDGRKDLVVGDLLGRIHVFLNTGADDRPVFGEGAMVSIAGDPVTLGPRAIVEVADVDGDGRKDLLVGNRLGGVYALLNVGTDAEPRFDAIEQLRDASGLWRELYAGLQHCLHDRMRQLYADFPAPGRPRPMDMNETSCPRVADFDGDGRPELLISHRYGRVFIYDKLPQPRSR